MIGFGAIAGAGDRSRTRDIFITSEALYQLSYTGMFAGLHRASGLMLPGVTPVPRIRLPCA